MTIRSAAVAVALLAVAGLTANAEAQDFAKYQGPYVSGAIGKNYLQDSDLGGSVSTTADWDSAFMGAAALGYAFGNGLRLEGELARRQNSGESVGGADASGDVEVMSALLNVAYDFSTGTRFTPYLGAGIGLGSLSSDLSPVGGGALRSDDTVGAYQAFVGVAYALADNLALTADLRYFKTNEAELPITTGGTADVQYEATSFLVGLRWNFGAPPPAPKAEPAQAPAAAPTPAPAPKKAEPAPAPQRSFLIFFDWDKSDIRADARKILEAAAAAAKKGSFVKVTLTGHADRSGPTGYNQRLSVRRAEAAKKVLTELGIPSQEIATVGRGETQPLVATADGVREPRNRRVEIQF